MLSAGLLLSRQGHVGCQRFARQIPADAATLQLSVTGASAFPLLPDDRAQASPTFRPSPLATPTSPPADFAITCSLVRPGRPVLVHRAAALLHAAFRRHLATTPWRF